MTNRELRDWINNELTMIQFTTEEITQHVKEANVLGVDPQPYIFIIGKTAEKMCKDSDNAFQTTNRREAAY